MNGRGEAEDIEAVLGAVNMVGETPPAVAARLTSAALAGSRQARQADPSVADLLRSYGDQQLATLEEAQTISSSSLCISADFLDLLDRFGEPEVWDVLGKLKDLLG